VALSGGRRVKVAPVAELMLSIVPVKCFPAIASTSISTLDPILTPAISVSLKFAMIHLSPESTKPIKGMPGVAS